VGVMQVPGNQVVEMVAMRNRFVTAGGAVHVARCVARALVGRRTRGGVGPPNLDHALVHMPVVRVVEVSVVQIVDVIAVAYGRVSARGPVLMLVIRVGDMRHGRFLRSGDAPDLLTNSTQAVNHASRSLLRPLWLPMGPLRSSTR